MKANEFRIGNLIDRTDYICVVDKIDKDGIITTPLDYKNERFVVQEIKPIKISEDWLLRLGFEKEKENTFIHIDNKNFQPWAQRRYTLIKFHYSGHSDEGEFDYWMLKRGDEFITETWGILYVHQLQNLYFALTGLELHTGA